MLSSQIPDEFKLGAHPVGYAKEPAQLLQGFGTLLLCAYEGCGLWEPFPIQSGKPFLEMADHKGISAHVSYSLSEETSSSSRYSKSVSLFSPGSSTK